MLLASRQVVLEPLAIRVDRDGRKARFLQDTAQRVELRVADLLDPPRREAEEAADDVPDVIRHHGSPARTSQAQDVRAHRRPIDADDAV
jgi:hypothetical protein